MDGLSENIGILEADSVDVDVDVCDGLKRGLDEFPCSGESGETCTSISS